MIFRISTKGEACSTAATAPPVRAIATARSIRRRAGLVRARTALVNTARGLEVLWGEAARVQCAQYESGESAGLLLVGIESLSEGIREYNERIEKLALESYPQVALLKQVKGVGTLITGFGLLPGAAAGTKELRPERAAAAQDKLNSIRSVAQFLAKYAA